MKRPTFPENFFRQADSHKTSGGRLLLLAGCWGYAGAGILAAQSALTAGCGYVVWKVPEKLYPIVGPSVLDGVVSPLEDQGEGCYLPEHVEYLNVDHSAVVMGPGLGSSDKTREFVLRWIQCVQKPMVIDADGLNLLKQDGGLLKEASGHIVITPHPGEAARLLNMTTDKVQKERQKIAQELRDLTGAVVLLKGRGTLVAGPSGVWKNDVDSATLATAGSGDVLSGMIGALLARGIEAEEATRLAVRWHGEAGVKLEKSLGPQGVGASALINSLQLVQKEWWLEYSSRK